MKKISISILIISFIGFLFWIQNLNVSSAKAKVEFLRDKGRLIGGTVIGKTYNSQDNIRYLSSVMYEYIVEDSIYSKSLSSHEAKAISFKSHDKWIDGIGIRKKDRFVVLYDSQNPDNSILCVDLPLEGNKNIKYYMKLLMN